MTIAVDDRRAEPWFDDERFGRMLGRSRHGDAQPGLVVRGVRSRRIAQPFLSAICPGVPDRRRSSRQVVAWGRHWINRATMTMCPMRRLSSSSSRAPVPTDFSGRPLSGFAAIVAAALGASCCAGGRFSGIDRPTAVTGVARLGLGVHGLRQRGHDDAVAALSRPWEGAGDGVVCERSAVGPVGFRPGWS